MEVTRAGMRRRATRVALATVVIGAFALPANAFAVDHFIKVREAFAGTTGAANTDFVELQMFAASQNQVANNLVHVYDSTGLLQDSYAFAANVTGTANNSSLLVSRQDAAAFFGPAPDLLDAAVEIPFGAGKACYEDVDGATAGIIDCVSWGNFTGNPLGEDGINNPESSSDDTGTPVAPPGIPNGNAIARDITGGSNPSLLDAGDDTGDSAADFDVSTIATPRNNAGAVATTAGAAAVAAGVLEFDAAAGVANTPTAFQAAGVRGVRDTAAPVVAGAGCIQTLTNEARCAAGPIEHST